MVFLVEGTEMNKTTEALKLAGLVEASVEECIGDDGMVAVIPLDLYNDLMATLSEALAETEITTPDVCGEVCARAKLCYGCGKALDEANAKLAESVKQEPVEIVVEVDRHGEATVAFGAWNLDVGSHIFYAAPVRTKDLTDSEIATLIQRHTIDGKIMPFALCEAAIAADREKNK